MLLPAEASTVHDRVPAWRRLTVIAAAGSALLAGCTTVPGVEADALVYNDDGTTSQEFYVNNGQTLHHTTTKACVKGSESRYVVTTRYEPAFAPAGPNPRVETFSSRSLCDGGRIEPYENGIPQSALTP